MFLDVNRVHELKIEAFDLAYFISSEELNLAVIHLILRTPQRFLRKTHLMMSSSGAL